MRFTVTGTRHRPLKVWVLDCSGYPVSGVKPKNVNGRGQATFNLASVPAGYRLTYFVDAGDALNDLFWYQSRVPFRRVRMSGFRGFPPGALDFLRELEDEQRARLVQGQPPALRRAARGAGAALGEELEAAGFGRPHLFRPWNDTRFHPGPPIKEQLGLAVGYEGAGGFYVELSLDGLFVAAGLHNPAPDQVERMRRLVADGRSAAPLPKAIAGAEAAGLG